MDFSLEDTIAAAASARGAGARAVIRLSGRQSRNVVEGVFEPVDPEKWRECRRAERHSGRVTLPLLTATIPAAAYVWPTARSYTGQPAVELHLIGSPPLVDAVLESLYTAGARPANAGEFTMRAFLAGRLDLLQAEAVLGVINAPDDARLRAALAQLAGGISGRLAAIRERLLLDLADLEAGLDFVEEDIEFIDRSELTERLASAEHYLEELRQQAQDRMHAPAVARVMLAGLPNAGKSTLFNTLVERDAALVSEHSGTTRDYLSARVVWDGRDIELVDTAGYEAAADGLMHSAGTLRDALLPDADLILWCTAGHLRGDAGAADERDLRQVEARAPQVLRVVTQIDRENAARRPGAVAVSGLRGDGLHDLRKAVLHALADAGGPHELIGSSVARCRDTLRAARQALAEARAAAEAGQGDELIAAELRAALDELGRITGRVHSEDLLDRIFSRFCIGK